MGRHVTHLITFVALLAGAPACWERGESDLFLSTGPRGGIVDGRPGAFALVGEWADTDRFVVDGITFVTQTVWAFRPDGTASRTSVTTNLLTGRSDVRVLRALWRVRGSTLILEFVSPDLGVTTVFWTVVDGFLRLGDTFYRRVA